MGLMAELVLLHVEPSFPSTQLGVSLSGLPLQPQFGSTLLAHGRHSDMNDGKRV